MISISYTFAFSILRGTRSAQKEKTKKKTFVSTIFAWFSVRPIGLAGGKNEKWSETHTRTLLGHQFEALALLAEWRRRVTRHYGATQNGKCVAFINHGAQTRWVRRIGVWRAREEIDWRA